MVQRAAMFGLGFAQQKIHGVPPIFVSPWQLAGYGFGWFDHEYGLVTEPVMNAIR